MQEASRRKLKTIMYKLKLQAVRFTAVAQCAHVVVWT
jgi:hypothetical protein